MFLACSRLARPLYIGSQVLNLLNCFSLPSADHGRLPQAQTWSLRPAQTPRHLLCPSPLYSYTIINFLLCRFFQVQQSLAQPAPTTQTDAVLQELSYQQRMIRVQQQSSKSTSNAAGRDFTAPPCCLTVATLTSQSEEPLRFASYDANLDKMGLGKQNLSHWLPCPFSLNLLLFLPPHPPFPLSIFQLVHKCFTSE
jgi:hypothetical protein